MGTVIVGAVLVVIVGLIVRSMIKDKKNGKSTGDFRLTNFAWRRGL